MRRNDRLIDDSAVLRAFLAQENVLHLGLTDGQAPYVVPMSYGFDWPEDGKPTFYLHCAGEGYRASSTAGRGYAGTQSGESSCSRGICSEGGS